MRTRYRIAVLLATAAIVLAACSSGGGTAAPSAAAPSAAAPSAGAASEAPASAAAGGEPVTVDWWHITTGDPGKADFQAAADAYMAAHPNVTIKITVLENEAFKTKLSTTAAADYPDLFQSWGGGIMAAQADAGLLKDITADIADWKDTINPGAMSIYAYNGKQYGVPWDMGMIGFWYNKALFEQAGITAPPTTWDEYLAAVEKLKAAGIEPLAIAGKDKWPSMHLWTYLVLRNGGGDALSEMIQSGNWNTDACTKAGEDVLALNALDPYQAGYKSADYNAEAASVGNGKAAMELMGQWAPSVQMDQSADKKGLGDDLGWFAVPDRRRRSRRSHRRRRRRQRHRRRRQRAAGGDRLPQVLQQRRQRQQAEHRQRRPVHGGRHGGLGQGPEPPGRPRGSRRCHVHAAVPRPGNVRRAEPGLQRRDDRAVPWPVHAGGGLPGPHRRGGRRVGAVSGDLPLPLMTSGPASPARSLPPR